VQDVRAYRGTDVASDHNLVIAKTLLNLNRTSWKVHVVKRYDRSKLNMPETRKKFQLELRNRFSCLSIHDDDDDDDDKEEEEGSGQEKDYRKKDQEVKRSLRETRENGLSVSPKKRKMLRSLGS